MYVCIGLTLNLNPYPTHPPRLYFYPYPYPYLLTQYLLTYLPSAHVPHAVGASLASIGRPL